MTDYRYLFGHWNTATAEVEIPLYGVYVRGSLGDIGYMQGTFQLDQRNKSGKSNADLVGATTPGQTFVAVQRDGILVWMGYVTSRTYQSQAKTIQLYAKSLEGYFEERILPLKELYSGGGDPDHYSVGLADQGDHFKRMVTDFTGLATHAGPLFPLFFQSADSTPTFGGGGFPVTGVTKTVNIFRYDYITYRQIIDDLANADDGFEWRIVPRFVTDNLVLSDVPGTNPSGPDALQIHKFVQFGYPTLQTGQSYDTTVFEYPGNILNYYRTDNLSDAGTTIIGVGAGEGKTMKVKEVTNQGLVQIAGGFYPKDVVIPMKHIDVQAVLDARTMQENVKSKPPRTTYKVSVRPDLHPQFGTYDLGSRATLIITDPMHPLGVTAIEVQVTIVEYELRPPSTDGGAEEISLGFADG